MAELPPPPEGIVLTHFSVSDDVERSRRFYTEVLGGRVAFSGPGGLTDVALSNSWIIINEGGGPTDDKPSVTLETPTDSDPVSSFLNIRVKDIETVYAELERPRSELPDTTETPPVRDPWLHPRPRRSSDRSRTNNRPRRRLDTPSSDRSAPNRCPLPAPGRGRRSSPSCSLRSECLPDEVQLHGHQMLGDRLLRRHVGDPAQGQN